jgi:hypothetical protein
MLSGVVITTIRRHAFLDFDHQRSRWIEGDDDLMAARFSNAGTSSSSGSRIAVEETKLISAALMAVLIIARPSALATVDAIGD